MKTSVTISPSDWADCRIEKVGVEEEDERKRDIARMLFVVSHTGWLQKFQKAEADLRSWYEQAGPEVQAWHRWEKGQSVLKLFVSAYRQDIDKTMDIVATKAKPIWSPGWIPVPEAAPRANEATTFSITLPTVQLTILREFARREDVSLDVLFLRVMDQYIRTNSPKL